MRNKVNLQWLKSAQNYSSRLNHPLLLQIYSHYYQYIKKFYQDITKKFNSVCIHGDYPHEALPFLTTKSNHFQHLLSVSHLSSPSQTNTLIQNRTLQIFDEEDKFDLIISCMEMHKSINYQALLQKYKTSLKPDGALIGCCFGEKTLSSLSRAYLLAENQRHGGVSPKVLNFPSVGVFGNSLSNLRFQIPTILTEEIEVEFESVTDLLTLLQLGGGSGIVKGRRKGVYKDLLLAMSAIFDTQQMEDEKKLCKQNIELISFIGWKYDESQPKRRKKGDLIEEATFANELKKHDPDLKQYKVSEKDDITEIK